MAQWTTKALDALEDVVLAVREKTVLPAQRVTRAIVFGLLSAFFVFGASIMVVIGLFRVLVVLTGDAWAAYLALGGICTLAGGLLWRLRAPRPKD